MGVTTLHDESISAGGAFGDILKDDFPAVLRYKAQIGNRVLFTEMVHSLTCS